MSLNVPSMGSMCPNMSLKKLWEILRFSRTTRKRRPSADGNRQHVVPKCIAGEIESDNNGGNNGHLSSANVCYNR